MGLKSVVDNIGRQGRKIKKLLTPPTENQKKIEIPVREQRAYAKGQAKVVGVGAVALLTQKAVNSMSKSKMEARLKEEEKKAIPSGHKVQLPLQQGQKFSCLR